LNNGNSARHHILQAFGGAVHHAAPIFSNFYFFEQKKQVKTIIVHKLPIP
jgi:hypothetical protein